MTKKWLVFILLLAFPLANSVFAAHIKGTISTKKLKKPGGILAYIDEIEGKEFQPSEESFIIDQKQMKYIPEFTVVLQGTKIGIKNSDSVLHNVFGVGDDEFDLGTWKGDEIRYHTFNKLGEVMILCDLHPSMEAFVVVLQNPYFTLTDEEGNYEIKDVPQGRYKLKTWHDQLRSTTKNVNVPPGKHDAVTVNLELNR